MWWTWHERIKIVGFCVNEVEPTFLPSEVCNNYVDTSYVTFLPYRWIIAICRKLGFEFLPYYSF